MMPDPLARAIATIVALCCLESHGAAASVGGVSSVAAAVEASRYATLPPTVFAPGGRLHGVERVAREASLFDVDDAAGMYGDLSCGALALRCGGGGNGEFAVMVGIGSLSPFLHRDAPWETPHGGAGDGATEIGKTYLPLSIDESNSAAGEASSSIGPPINVLSPTLIVGAGGRAVDSTILLRRAAEATLAMYEADDGGVDWFVAHSMEGTGGDPGDVIGGGAAGVEVASLVRRLADIAQASTQSLGGRYGRMLSSSLLAVGARDRIDFDDDALALWCVEPTGQFWRSEASAVGRGCVRAEAALLQRVRAWGAEHQGHHDREDSDSDLIGNDDVRAYLGSLSVKEAVEVATDCLLKGIMESGKQDAHGEDARCLTSIIEAGLRKRVQAVVIQSSVIGKLNSCVEIF